MAKPNRELITKNFNPSGAYEPLVNEYKDLLKELIRLDVPILEIGSSSIGKSYSIRQFMEEAGVKGEFLFVGTEKSEFIEGIPNLKAVVAGQAKFSYLKPYWFPDKEVIRTRLLNGKAQIDALSNTTISAAGFNTFGELWVAATIDYSKIETVKTELLKFRRSEESLAELKKQLKAQADASGAAAEDIKPGKYEYEDALLYISTLEGYGNFWLILDEIDKVEKMDKDKYAPLLHIVRERELKGWKLSGLRGFPEYDIKYVTNITQRIGRLNAALLNKDVDVTDTRIIAIANDLQVMEEESPALYRRFVKVIIRESLYNEANVKLPEGDSSVAVGYDWASEYEISRQNIHNCIIGKEVDGGKSKQKAVKEGLKSGMQYSGDSILKQMAFIEPEKCGKPLNEMNLQWTLGFFPDILFPMLDETSMSQGAMFITNNFIKNFNEEPDPYKTIMAKVIQDNFESKYWVPLLQCIYDKIVSKGTVTSGGGEPIDNEVEDLFKDIGLTPATFDAPDPAKVQALLNKYQIKLDFVTSKFKEALTIDQTGRAAVTDKALSEIKGGTTGRASASIVFGNKIYLKSLRGNKPTELTRMLMSAVPFMQTRFICSSPYIAYGQAQELIAIHDNGLIYFIEKVSGKKFESESEAKAATASVFGVIEPYKPYIVKYAVGVTGQDAEDIANGDYSKILKEKRAIQVIEDVTNNTPVIVDNTLAGLLSPKDTAIKTKYFNSIASVKLIEKEIHQNLSYEVWPMITNSIADGLTAELKLEIDEYCKTFPTTMADLSEALDQGKPNEKDLYDYIKIQSDLADANGTGAEIDRIGKIVVTP